MKVLIATGIYPPQIGGPAKYAGNLAREFGAMGHRVSVSAYGPVERALPFGLRHAFYFLRLLPRFFGADAVLALDTVSVGLPAILCVRLFGKRIVVRPGGDFLWESYVERTGNLVPLPLFYTKAKTLSVKEQLLFRVQRFVLRHASVVAFNTPWLRDIWRHIYELDISKTCIIQNYCVKEAASAPTPVKKVFLASGRALKLKNTSGLREAFALVRERQEDISLDDMPSSPDEFLKRLRECYAVVVASISEVSPNVIFEAVSLGKLFIVTEHSGLPKDLKRAGIEIDPLNIESMSTALLFLSDDAEYAKRKALVSALSCNHGWQEIAKEFIRLFETK